MTEREHRYVIRGDVIHVDPTEQCNLDDSVRDEGIDPASAQALVNQDLARYCEHCGMSES